MPRQPRLRDRRRQPPPAARQVLVPHRLHRCADDRIALIIGNAAGDDAAARQREIDLLDDLRVREIQRPAAFERTALAEFERRRIRPC